MKILDKDDPSYGTPLMYQEHSLKIDIIELESVLLEKHKELIRTRALMSLSEIEYGYAF